MTEISPQHHFAASPRGAATRLLAAAVFSAVIAGGPSLCTAQSNFMSPTVTSDYLKTLRNRASTYRDDPFGTGAVDTTQRSQTYGTEGRGTAIGESLFDFSRTEAARPRQSTYDEITRSALFPPTSSPQSTLNESNYESYYSSLRQIANDSRERVELFATRSDSFNPYQETVENPITNPYRSYLFQPTASVGRFGTQTIDLSNRLPTGRSAAARDNINLGIVTARLVLIAGLSYTDNALFAREDKTSDLIGQIGFRLTTRQQLTKENIVSFEIGVGYDRYLLNPEINDIIASSGIDFSISPRSNIAFETSIGNVFVRVFDNFGVTQRNQDDALAEAETNYTRFNNTVGVAASLQLNQSTSFTVSLNRTDNIALDTAFSDADSVSYNFLGDIEYSPGQKWAPGSGGVWNPSAEESWVAGLTVATVATTRSSSSTLSDSTTLTVGPYFQTPISRFTRIRISGGIQQGQFDTASSTTTTTTSPGDLNDYFASLNIFNQLNNFTSQSFRIGHETGLGTTSNFFIADFVRHNFTFNLGPRTTLSTTVYLEHQADSPGGTSQETLVRQGAALNLVHQLNSKVTIYLGFISGSSDSTLIAGTPTPIRDPNDPTRFLNTPGTDIKQETFTFDIAFPFARDIDMVLGYRRLATSSSNLNGNFVENRGSINFSYNF